MTQENWPSGTEGAVHARRFDCQEVDAFPGAAFGAVTGSAATSLGLGALREARSAINADARRTAEQIVRRVAELKHW